MSTSRLLAVFAIAFIWGPGLVAQDLLPLGDDLAVNTYTTDKQNLARVAMLDDGSFLVVWASRFQNGTSGSFDIVGRLYDPSGNPGDELEINDHTPVVQFAPAITEANGGFVVTWDDDRGLDGETISARLFNGDGTPLGDSFEVFDFGQTQVYDSDVDANRHGDFVVTWTSAAGGEYSVRGRRFASDGTAITGELEISDLPEDRQENGKVAMRDDGSFMVVWSGQVPSGGSGPEIHGRLFDSAGTASSESTMLNQGTVFTQTDPDIAPVPGGFVVTWTNDFADGSFGAIAARRFDHSGNPIGDQFQVNTYTDHNQRQPTVGADAEGNFTITWRSTGQDGDQDGVFAQRFDASGERIGDEFQVAVATAGQQTAPHIDTAPSGDLVITWDRGPNDPLSDVFGRAFGIDTDEDGVPDRTDNCPQVANSDQVDGDLDGAGAACDCDDTQPSAQVPDRCGICGGDESSCGVFADGFESGSTTAWSSSF